MLTFLVTSNNSWQLLFVQHISAYAAGDAVNVLFDTKACLLLSASGLPFLSTYRQTSVLMLTYRLACAIEAIQLPG